MADKSYHPFIMAMNKSYSVKKKMFVCKIPKILNRMMLFKQECMVKGLNND